MKITPLWKVPLTLRYAACFLGGIRTIRTKPLLYANTSQLSNKNICLVSRIIPYESTDLKWSKCLVYEVLKTIFLNLTIQTIYSKIISTLPQQPQHFHQHHHPAPLALLICGFLNGCQLLLGNMEPENHLPNLPFLGSMIPYEPCSKPFLDLNAISRPYACTLRNTYATTIGAYAEDYGQHNLTHCLRDPVSWRKMTPHCSVSLPIPMAQGRYLDNFLVSGFLFERITQGFQYLIASTSRSYK